MIIRSAQAVHNTPFDCLNSVPIFKIDQGDALWLDTITDMEMDLRRCRFSADSLNDAKDRYLFTTSLSSIGSSTHVTAKK
jgi:hypothetical protein